MKGENFLDGVWLRERWENDGEALVGPPKNSLSKIGRKLGGENLIGGQKWTCASCTWVSSIHFFFNIPILISFLFFFSFFYFIFFSLLSWASVPLLSVCFVLISFFFLDVIFFFSRNDFYFLINLGDYICIYIGCLSLFYFNWA